MTNVNILDKKTIEGGVCFTSRQTGFDRLLVYVDSKIRLVCLFLFDLILYVPSTIFQL